MKLPMVYAVIATAMFGLTACERSAQQANLTQATPPATTATVSTDSELEQLKSLTPVDACAWLTPAKLAAIFPQLTFNLHQKIEPRISGYAWDSRCEYWAGEGSIELAKNIPTHTVTIFVTTRVSADKAKSELAHRHEAATTATGYQTQPSLGENAYSISNTGVVDLFFIKNQSEVQIQLSDITTPNDKKIEQALRLAQSL